MKKRKFSIYHLKKFRTWKKSVCLSFIYLMISSVFAISLNAEEEGQLKYDDPQIYNKPTFWTNDNVDFSKVQWSNVDFSKIPFKDMTEGKLGDFYKNLPDDKIAQVPAKDVDVTLVTDKFSKKYSEWSLSLSINVPANGVMFFFNKYSFTFK